MTDQKYKDLMNGGWSYPKKESTDPEEVKKVVDKYLTDNKIDSLTIDKKITDGISKIVADAPEDFDTLKEMSDWISEHEDSAAAMNSAILDNKSSIDILKTDKANATDVETLSSEVDDNANNIVDINSSMSDYGLNNVFDGELEQGFWDMHSGTYTSRSNWVCSKNKIPCKVGDKITLKCDIGNEGNNGIVFFNSNGNYVSGTKEVNNAIVPTNATSFVFNVYSSTVAITPSTAGHVGVYVNNQIDISNDKINDSLSALGKCKNLLKTTLGSGNGDGITYINNGDGTYILNGTCTTTHELHFNPVFKLPYGKYKLLGTSAYQKTNNGEWRATVSSGGVFEVSESKPVLDVMAYISSGSVVNETIKPMVTTNLNATENDFVPYTGDGDTLTADVAKIKNDMTWKRVARVTTTSTDDVISVLPDTWKEVMVDIEDTTTSLPDNCYARSVFTIYRECVTYNGNNYFRTGYANLVVNITGNHSIKIPEMNSETAVTIYYRN